MLRFLQFILLEVAMAASGKTGKYHSDKYVKTGQKLTLNKGHEDIESGTEMDVIGSSIDSSGKHYAHVKHPNGKTARIPLNKFEKPTTIGNTEYARYYESLVAHHIHTEVQKAKKNKVKGDPFDTKVHREALASNPDLIQKAEKNARDSADQYLSLLKKSEKEGGRGIKLSDVESVHHTAKGIQSVTGNEQHGRANNPHDVLLKLKNNKFVGASLKGGQETVSNNGFGKISVGERKLNPEHRGDLERAATEHANMFNTTTNAIKREHLKTLFKGSPDVPLDRVGFKNKKPFAETNEKSEHIKSINHPHNEFAMHHVGNGVIYISARRRGTQTWMPLGRLDHRTTSEGVHRVDAKLAKKIKAPEEQTSVQAPKLNKTSIQDVSGRIDHGHVTTNAPY